MKIERKGKERQKKRRWKWETRRRKANGKMNAIRASYVASSLGIPRAPIHVLFLVTSVLALFVPNQ